MFYSCERYDSTKPTEFFRIKNSTDDRSSYEAFVVYNHPNDTSLLLKMAENYNLRTVPPSLLKQADYNGYVRVFYKKSKFLTRDFEPGTRDLNPNSPYTYQELNAFTDDKIITIEYAKRYDGKYQYIYYFKDIEARTSVTLHDLDSFYHAKWIETADIDTALVK